jgi:tRNA threonylcarbamoyladenosine biosynthesis protein TsaE
LTYNILHDFEMNESIELQAHVLVSPSVEKTHAWGEALGAQLQLGDVIALQGDLGAGKTNFVQGLAHGLGITEDVNSPTFILANEYLSGRLPLYHIDAYRLENAAEARGFGLDDYLNGEGVTVIEWAERVREALPYDVLWIVLEYVSDNERQLTITASGAHSAELAKALDYAARN